ncbi:MAG: VOC family protein [Candidatus Hodarchaeales archaeon]
MRDPKNAFHLAIPCKDLKEIEEFYIQKLECHLSRKYDDRITFNFFGDQIVCHLAPQKIDTNPMMYPRHFGITFREKKDYNNLIEKVKDKGLQFFQEPMIRFKGKPEEHLTFFLIDPSNNIIEFKYYHNSDMMY